MTQQTSGTQDPRKSYRMDLIKISYCVIHKLHWITDCPECIHMDYDQNSKMRAADDMYEALKLTRNNLQTLSDAALHYKRTFSPNLDILNKALAEVES